VGFPFSDLCYACYAALIYVNQEILAWAEFIVIRADFRPAADPGQTILLIGQESYRYYSRNRHPRAKVLTSFYLCEGLREETLDSRLGRGQ
jgi:hypothetical protein